MGENESGATATPQGAREHARAQEAAAATVAYKPIIPPDATPDVPAGVTREDLVWSETLGPGGYAAKVLTRGTRLRIESVDGDASVAFLAYNADAPCERLNIADTVKVQWQAYLGEGSLLLSDMGRVLLSIVRDTSGNHDTFCGASSPWSHRAKFGDGDNHGPRPSARERFALALAKFGMTKRDIVANVNFFRSVRVDPDGSLHLDPARCRAGDFVELRAEMKTLVVVVSSPHVLDPRPEFAGSPVRLLAWRGPTAPRDCPIRHATPERRRAFENVDDYYGVG